MSDIELIQPTEDSQQTSLEDKEILKGLAALGIGGDVQIDYPAKPHENYPITAAEGLCALDPSRKP